MAVRKEIIVLSGGGHKGVVKISGVTGKDNVAKVSCTLDFRPIGAILYLVGDNIAQIRLNDINCEVEVPFSAEYETGCVVRSSSLTMFGGKGAKSLMLKRIDDFARAESQKGKATGAKTTQSDNGEVYSDKKCKASRASNASGESKLAHNSQENNAGANCEVSSAIPSESDGIDFENNEGNENAKEHSTDNLAKQNKSKPYVGVSAKGDVKPLGEWIKYDGNNFYYAVKPQIDEMFICYPEEKLLNDSVPNSKWVRVDAEDGYYVVGLLFDEDEPSFICYGVPQPVSQEKNARRAPEELENMCVWLPLNDSDGVIDGYWMIYQSAKTGEIIK
ncbi:MAG: hypothetical protein K2G31_02830 [Clostridia bacterium]|nr:hypothetical protein [Clostridia bacterium]